MSALTVAVWVRSRIFGRILLEMDASRYDGDEWNHLTIAGILSATLSERDDTPAQTVGSRSRQDVPLEQLS